MRKASVRSRPPLSFHLSVAYRLERSEMWSILCGQGTGLVNPMLNISILKTFVLTYLREMFHCGVFFLLLVVSSWHIHGSLQCSTLICDVWHDNIGWCWQDPRDTRLSLTSQLLSIMWGEDCSVAEIGLFASCMMFNILCIFKTLYFSVPRLIWTVFFIPFFLPSTSMFPLHLKAMRHS